LITGLFHLLSKKSPTGPSEWTPQSEYLIALAHYLGVHWDSVLFDFLMDTYKWTYIGGTSPHLVTIHPNFLAPTSKLLLQRCCKRFSIVPTRTRDDANCNAQHVLETTGSCGGWSSCCFGDADAFGEVGDPQMNPKKHDQLRGASQNDGNFLRCNFLLPQGIPCMVYLPT